MGFSSDGGRLAYGALTSACGGGRGLCKGEFDSVKLKHGALQDVTSGHMRSSLQIGLQNPDQNRLRT